MSAVFANLNLERVDISSDHAGFALKDELVKKVPGLRWCDLGPSNEDSVDYPDYADRVAHALFANLSKNPCGVLICGSGQGMAIRANRFPFLRAALCWNEEIARLARAHNNANVLCLPGRHVDFATAQRVLQVFLHTPFEGGRHERRVAKLSSPAASTSSRD